MEHADLDEFQREEDAQFLRNLIALSGGDPTSFQGFDPSSWRDIGVTEDGWDNVVHDPSTNVDSDDETGGLVPTAHNLKNITRHYDDWDRPYKLNKAHALAADVPDVLKSAAELEKEGLAWGETGLAVGDAAHEDDLFAPWKLVSQYCDMFVGKKNGERAAPYFTLEGLHQNRIWDLFYLHQPTKLGPDNGPVLFVPTYQFEHLLDVVNAKLEINLTIPPGKNSDKFKLRFGAGNGPRPRFLGRSDTAGRFSSLLHEGVPSPNPEDDLENVSHYGRDALLDILQMIEKASPKPKKSEKNRYKRTIAHREWGRAVKRTQRYLGLREKNGEYVAGGNQPTMLDLDQPMAAKPEGSVLFVCIDIEAYEFNQDLITEVGIAVLDATRLSGIAPGENGKAWHSLIEARHIRVKENAWAVNSKWVQGCADKFDFGNTEFMKQSDIASFVEEAIDHATMSPSGLNSEPRPVVLVFHESAADIKYLQTIGYNAFAASNVIDVIDSKEMHQYILRSNNSCSLERVLGYLDIPYRYLHNAGNDAVYTLRAMLGLAVKKRIMSLESAVSGRTKGHVTVAELREKEGWSSGGEDTDGGNPKGLAGIRSS